MTRTGKSLVFVLMVVASQAYGQQYRWLDQKGRVQYTDTPPPATAKNVQKKNFGGVYDGVPEPYALGKARRAAPVKLYTTPGCGDCDDARTFLNARGIPFTEINVVETKERDELRLVSGRTGVPVLLVGTAMQRSYDDSSYNRLLDEAGYPKLGNLAPRNQVTPPKPAKAP